MGRNTAAIKRGFSWDSANSALDIFVNGVKSYTFTTTAVTNLPAGSSETVTTASAFYPAASDGNALGTASYMWADLFLASGGVINWNNGDVTLTHAANALNFAGGCLNMYASGSEYAYTAGTPCFTLYATNAGTSGSTNAEPFYVKSILTGAGQVGGRSRFHCYSNVVSGGWVNALKSYMEFGASGKTTGLASSMCVEMSLPNVDLGSGGAYFPLEIEHTSGGSSLVTAGSLSGNHTGFIYMAATGDEDGDFDDNGYLFHITGLTSGSGHLFYANKSVPFDAYLRIGVGTATYYIGLLAQQSAASS